MQFERTRVNDEPRTKAGGITLRKQIVNWIVILIMVFSFTTLIQSLVDKISINKIVGGGITVLLLFLFLLYPERKAFFRLFVLITIGTFTLIYTPSISKDLNDLIFLFATVLMLINMSNQTNMRAFQDSVERHVKAIKVLVLIECLIIALLLVTQTGYSYHWGEGRFFQGLCNSQHTLASLACLIISFIIYIVHIKKEQIMLFSILLLIPTYAIFESGARVFLFPLAILLFLYIQSVIKNKIYRVLIYIVGIIASIILILHSNMVDKFVFVTGNKYASDLTSAFTSGRSEFWKADIELFTSGNLIELLIGKSFAEVYATNLQKVNLEIWAHNDIIHLLVGMGLIGCITYVAILCATYKKIMSYIRDKLLLIIMIMYVVIPMLLNGFFTYQHFVYSFFILYFVALNMGGRVKI